MFRLSLALMLLVTCSRSTSLPARAHDRSQLVVKASAHGVELQLSLPNRVYRRNALVKVAVTMRNLSHRTEHVAPSCAVGAARESWAETVTKEGLEVFPQVIAPPGPLSVARCPVGVTFKPGQSITDANLVILWTGYLHARLMVTTGTIDAEVVTPVLGLRLEPGRSPRATVRVSGGLHADITPPFGAHGSLIYAQSFQCLPSSVIIGAPQVVWERTSTRRIAPRAPPGGSCKRVIQWRAVAGWLNHPVVSIKRRAPAGGGGTA